MQNDIPEYRPKNLLAGDFPRISKLLWFHDDAHLLPGAVVAKDISLIPKIGASKPEFYELFDVPLINRVMEMIKDRDIVDREGIVDKIEDRVDEALDKLFTRFHFPVGILAEEVKPSKKDKQAAVWITGCFNPNEIYAGKAVKISTITKFLEDHSIFLKEVF